MQRGAPVAWWLLIGLLGLPALCLPLVDLHAPWATWPPLTANLALHPDQGLHQPPWVWWSCAWLHGSAAHLWRNLAALLMLGALGQVLRPSWPDVVRLAIAWPLTHLGMLAQSNLPTYVGLSGVLHALAALLLMGQLFRQHPVVPRALSVVGLLGLVTKVLLENPWQMTLVADPRSAINVAPWVHFCGAVAGLALGALGARTQAGKP